MLCLRVSTVGQFTVFRYLQIRDYNIVAACWYTATIWMLMFMILYETAENFV